MIKKKFNLKGKDFHQFDMNMYEKEFVTLLLKHIEKSRLMFLL